MTFKTSRVILYIDIHTMHNIQLEKTFLAFWRPIWFLWLQLSLPAPIVGPWPFTCCSRWRWMSWPTMLPLASWAVWVQCHGSRLCSSFKRCNNEGWKRIKRHMVHWPKLLNEAGGWRMLFSAQGNVVEKDVWQEIRFDLKLRLEVLVIGIQHLASPKAAEWNGCYFDCCYRY